MKYTIQIFRLLKVRDLSIEEINFLKSIENKTIIDLQDLNNDEVDMLNLLVKKYFIVEE